MNSTLISLPSMYSSTIASCLKDKDSAFSRERWHEVITVHGYHDEAMYRRWKAMKNRCHNPNSRQYKNYGGRGITVCDEWRYDYAAFREWALSNGYDDEPGGGRHLIFADRRQQLCATDLDCHYYYNNLIRSPGQVLIRKSSIPEYWSEHTLIHNGSDDAFLWILMLCNFMLFKHYFLKNHQCMTLELLSIEDDFHFKFPGSTFR